VYCSTSSQNFASLEHRHDISQLRFIISQRFSMALRSGDWGVHLKGQFAQKWQCCHHLLTLKFFQTCMNFLLLNRKEDILKNVSNQTSDVPHWLPYIFPINSSVIDILQIILSVCVRIMLCVTTTITRPSTATPSTGSWNNVH